MKAGELLSVGMTATGVYILCTHKEKTEIEKKAFEYDYVQWIDTDFTDKELQDMLEGYKDITITPAPFYAPPAYLTRTSGTYVAWDTGYFNGMNYCMNLYLDGDIEPFYYVDHNSLERSIQKMRRDNWEKFGISTIANTTSAVLVGLGKFPGANALVVGYSVFQSMQMLGFTQTESLITGTALGIIAGGAMIAGGPAGIAVAAVITVVAFIMSIVAFFKKRVDHERAKAVGEANYQLLSNVAYAHLYQLNGMKQILEDRRTIYDGKLEDALLDCIVSYADVDNGSIMKKIRAISEEASKDVDRYQVPRQLTLIDFEPVYQLYNNCIVDVINLKKGYEWYDAGLRAEAERQYENFFNRDAFKTIISSREYLETAGISPATNEQAFKTFFKLLSTRLSYINVSSSVGGKVEIDAGNKYCLSLPYSEEDVTYEVTYVSNKHIPQTVEISSMIEFAYETYPVREYAGKSNETKYQEVRNRIEGSGWFNNVDYRTLCRAKEELKMMQSGYTGVCTLVGRPVALEASHGGNSLILDQPFKEKNSFKFSTKSSLGAIYEGQGGVDPFKVPLLLKAEWPIKVKLLESFDPEAPFLPGVSVDINLLEALEKAEESYPDAPIVAAYMLLKGRIKDVQGVMERLTKGLKYNFESEDIYKYPGIVFSSEPFADNLISRGDFELLGPTDTYYNLEAVEVNPLVPSKKVVSIFTLKEEFWIPEIDAIKEDIEKNPFEVAITYEPQTRTLGSFCLIGYDYSGNIVPAPTVQPGAACSCIYKYLKFNGTRDIGYDVGASFTTLYQKDLAADSIILSNGKLVNIGIHFPLYRPISAPVEDQPDYVIDPGASVSLTGFDTSVAEAIVDFYAKATVKLNGKDVKLGVSL